MRIPFLSPLPFVLLLSLLLFNACTRKELPERENHPLSGDEQIIDFPQGKRGARFIEISPGEPKTLNPLNSSDATSSGVIALLHEGLTSYHAVEEKVIPGLAKSWEISPDFKSYTFHLREGVRFSDGHPLSAEDVLFTFQCIYDKRYPNRTRDFFVIDNNPFQITKIDERTIRIQLPQPYAPFLEMIGMVEILPKHLLFSAFESGDLLKSWTTSEAKNSPEKFVGAGKFKLFSYETGQRILLIPNPYSWQINTQKERLPYIDLYLIQFVSDINASLVQFASGNSDAMGVQADQYSWIKKQEKKRDFTIYDRGPSSGTSFVWFNLNEGNNKEGKPLVEPYKLKWFQSKQFRQAISHAIDRKGLIDGVLLGRGAPLWSFYSPANGKWHNPSASQYPFSIEKSRQLLESIGMKQKEDRKLYDDQNRHVTFTLITNQENAIRQNIATTIQQNLKELGITVELKFSDFNTFISKIDQTYDYEAGLLGLTGGGDPAGSLSVLMSTGQNNLWYPQQKKPFTPWQAKIDQLMQEQLVTMNESQRIQKVHQIQQILSDELPLIYLLSPNSYFGIKNKWQNLAFPVSGSPLWNLESLWSP